MAGKKYRPALFELVGKGRLKPNKSGSLKTPEWFYTNDMATAPMRKEPKVVAGEELDFPVKPTAQPEDSDEQEELQRGNNFGLRLFDGKLALWAPYWAIGIVVLGLILCFLVVFWLGQTSVAAYTSEMADLAALNEGDNESETMAAVGGEIESRTEDNAQAASSNQRAGMTSIGSATENNQTSVAGGKGKNCLILSTLGNERDLRDLQGYFSSKGILTKIGPWRNSNSPRSWR